MAEAILVPPGADPDDQLRIGLSHSRDEPDGPLALRVRPDRHLDDVRALGHRLVPA